MALQSITNINVDFYDKKYILINAKQLDKNSRYLSVTCYNHGKLFRLNSGEHSAYIRYRKSDDYGVFNFCEINRDGLILVELTEQMLASEGFCYADLVVVNKGDAKVDSNTGEIILIDNASILSTMTFCIDVQEVPVNNYEIESSYEYDGLNIALQKAEAEYTEVMKTSKSWAVGGTGIRDGEDTNNSMYWANQSSDSANDAYISEWNAAQSESNASASESKALEYSGNAYTYMNNAEDYMDNAKTSESNAKTSESNAKISETNASASESNAKTSEINSKTSENNALDSANKAQSYAVGGTGTRSNEDTDNAHYYYELTKNIVVGLDSGFIPMGTISFAELESAEKATGYVYNISDNFITDNTFREGEGKSYTAGTNVYYTANGEWDCFGGSTAPTATVDEVISYLGL